MLIGAPDQVVLHHTIQNSNAPSKTAPVLKRFLLLHFILSNNVCNRIQRLKTPHCPHWRFILQKRSLTENLLYFAYSKISLHYPYPGTNS